MNYRGSFTGGTSGILYKERRDFFLNPKETATLYADAAPFLSLLDSLGTQTTQDPDYKMFEYRQRWASMNAVNTQAVSWYGTEFDPTQTTKLKISASDSNFPQWVVVGDTLEFFAKEAGTRKNGKNEDVSVAKNDSLAKAVVTDIAADGTVSLYALDAAGDGSTTIALAQDDTVRVYSHADEEGGWTPDAWSDELEIVWNSTQIIRTSVSVTGTLAAINNLRGARDELARLNASKYQEHKIKINNALMHGVRIGGLGAPNHIVQSHPIRTTMGIIPALKRYGVADKNLFVRQWANYDIDDFIDDMKAASQYDSGDRDKVALCGLTVISNISKTGEGSFLHNSGTSIVMNDWKTSEVGFRIRTLQHPLGRLHLVVDRSLSQPPYDNMMVVIDPEYVKRVVFRPDAFRTGLQSEQEDAVINEYFSDTGLMITLIEKHALFMFK